MTMSPEVRQRMLDAAGRGLRWRREKIMIARLTFNWISWAVAGNPPDWHSLFECDRCGHHPLATTWDPRGPYDFADTVDTSGRLGR